jgi:hypothetical protein
MILEELIREAESLKKPALLLGNEPTESGIVAYWGGGRVDMPEEMPPQVQAFRTRHHLLTISESLYELWGFDHACRFGAVGLFEHRHDDGESAGYRVECDNRKLFQDLSFTGTPLYATAADSFPPFQALCLYGSDRLGAWLREIGCKRHEYWKVEYGWGGPENKALVDAFEKEFIRRSLFFHPDSAAVIVGGWHMMWPDDDFYTPAELTLLFLTSRDAEPWFEGWHCPMSRSFFVRERIT